MHRRQRSRRRRRKPRKKLLSREDRSGVTIQHGCNMANKYGVDNRETAFYEVLDGHGQLEGIPVDISKRES